jgi:hypothetical protein
VVYLRGGGAICSMAFVSITGKSAAPLRNDLTIRDACYGLAKEADIHFPRTGPEREA